MTSSLKSLTRSVRHIDTPPSDGRTPRQPKAQTERGAGEQMRPRPPGRGGGGKRGGGGFQSARTVRPAVRG